MIDIGACAGETALPFLALGCSVEMYDPDPECEPRLRAVCEQYRGRAVHYPIAVVTNDAQTVTFQKRSMGLSGLGDSPFGALLKQITVPARAIGDVCASAADILKIDVEGFDLELLNAIDFALFRPRIVMVEFGLHFGTQGLAEVRYTFDRMLSAGYAGVIFNNRKLPGFGTQNWECELARIALSPDDLGHDGDRMGNILFYRVDDTLFLTCFVMLLESFLPARARPTFATDGADVPWEPPSPGTSS
jgi:FkbM family methyltransferase